MKHFTIHQSYKLMYQFLIHHWEENKESFNDLPVLLSSMQLADDEKPIDEALWEDWLKATLKEPLDTLTIYEVFTSMLRYLKGLPWEEIKEIANRLELNGEKPWVEWVCKTSDDDKS